VPDDADVDCGALYERERLGFLDLVGSLDPDQLATPVPATPAWTVKDVVGHLVGITADLNAQSFGSGSADDWTAAQVDVRRAATVDDLREEWDREAPTFEDGLRIFGYELGSHYVGDLLQHRADVHQALRLGRLAADRALLVGLDHYLATFDEALRDGGTGSVQVTSPDGTDTFGTGPLVASLRADAFELFRCFGGRRSAQQVRAMDWDGDVEVVLPQVSPYPLPEQPLVE
jgi:uncharacterized protein (TIGR03083 family)